MTDIMKQRLLGSLLLLCVIAVTAFYLVKNANNTSVSHEQVIEQVEFVPTVEPITEETVDVSTEAPEPVVDTPQPEQSPAVDSIEGDTAKVESISPSNNSNAQQSWTIQLGSFSVQENAQALKDKASKLGYDVKIKQVITQDRSSYRVRIGPEYDRQQVDKIVNQLAAQLAIKPQVLLSNPENNK
ncbi:MAG: SPOR domain-containing protein [Gammaproteobacteria bacterium]|nr:SPOR domain-containing protein [Gammaproteobacteria bacterium]MDH5591802.1 SPOR domain-containing protein [Gammaproteobacteria bacterium]